MITVQPIRCPAHFLRLIDERRCGLHVRSDGLPPFTATCVLVPTLDDPAIAEVCGLTLARTAPASAGTSARCASC